MTRQPLCNVCGNIVERERSCIDETVYFPVCRGGVVSDYPAC